MSFDVRPTRVIELSLFLLAFFWTLAQLPLGLAAPGFGQPYELTTIASNLAATGEFRDPFGIVTGPTAHVAPIYTLLLAAVIKLLADPVKVTLAMSLLNACFYGLAAAMMPPLSRRVYGHAAPGVAGGVMLAASGWLMPQWEMALTSLLFLVAAFGILWGGGARAGLWSGACLLANPASLPALALLVFSRSGDRARASGAERRRFAMTVAVLALVVCTPWILRNWAYLGSPFFVRDNFGLELYVSNNDRASAELVTNSVLWDSHPNQNREEAQVVAALGEGRYNQMRRQDATDWIRTHPRQFLGLSAMRTFYYWFPSPREGWPASLYSIITAFCCWGVWISRKNRLAMSLAIAAVSYAVLFAFIETHVRYRFPSLWITALLAGRGVYGIWSSRTALSRSMARKSPAANLR